MVNCVSGRAFVVRTEFASSGLFTVGLYLQVGDEQTGVVIDSESYVESTDTTFDHALRGACLKAAQDMSSGG